MANAIMTRELVEQAVEVVEFSIRRTMRAGIANRHDLHIVVMNPAVQYSSDSQFEDAIYYEHSIGDPSKWPYPFDEIARGKAALSWRTGMPSHHVQQFASHLYLDGDVRHGGSTILDGIVVACSGVQGHFDRMFAEWIASAIRGMSVDRMRTYEATDPPSFFGAE